MNEQIVEVSSNKESKFLDEKNDLQLWLLGTDTIPEFNEFIFKVYNQAFSNDEFKVPKDEIIAQTKENFHRTRVCGVRHKTGTLIGTWGLVLKSVDDVNFKLPIENIFKISVLNILKKMDSNEVRYVFNGWRNAVDKDALELHKINRNNSIFVFDFLLRGLTLDLKEESKYYLGVAEMEMLVYKYHRRVGIPWEIIGDPIHFWGKDRYPCAFKPSLYKEYLKIHHPERYKFIYE